MKRNIAIKISYDGTCFHGWQFQKNAKTVQETLQIAWKKLTSEEINLVGSSRTDAGVHAKSLIANFITTTTIPTEKIHLAWNTYLPEGLSVVSALDVSPEFNARFDSIGKFYSYYLYLSSSKPTYLRNLTAYVSEKLNIADMQKATQFFVGEKDFSSLMDQGSPVQSTVRKIIDTRVELVSPQILRIDIIGNAFLYHMVRIIVGTLLYVGNGKIECERLPHLLKTGDRRLMGKTMPPQGLFLNKVFYNQKLFGSDSLKDFNILSRNPE